MWHLQAVQHDSDPTPLALESRRSPATTSQMLRGFLRSSPIGAVGAGVLLVFVVCAVLANWIAPYDPIQPHYEAMQQPPSRDHLLGTDHLGRDVLSRVIHGSQVTLIVATTSVLAGNLLGFLWGLGSGYIGNRFDIVSQRLVEVLMAFPGLILAMLLIAALGTGFTTIIIAIAITQIPGATRITRSVVLSVKETTYVESARAVGATPLRTMLRHVAPQCIAPMLVVITVDLGGAIFTEAALSFLGVGIPPPRPSWGNMLGGVLAQAFRPPWWLAVFPGIAIALTVLSANLLGDALRDFLDPRVRRQAGK